MSADRLITYSYYQKIAAEKYNAQIEVSIPGGTQCDLVNETHAIEVDFTDK